MPTTFYEQRLSSDARWALSEGSRFFEEKSAVQDALRKITRRLRELGIPYALAEGMALFQHGFRRFTEDVDILVTRDGLRLLHEKLDGLGYVPPFAGSKNLRDTESGVRIEFLVTGDFPGDGKPKPVAFPDPELAAERGQRVRLLPLAKLIELKIASGASAPHRLRDLADVIELVRTQGLAREFAATLDASVRAKYLELWQAAQTRDPE